MKIVSENGQFSYADSDVRDTHTNLVCKSTDSMIAVDIDDVVTHTPLGDGQGEPADPASIH